MRKFVWGLVPLLLVIHYDFWWWNDEAVIFGFMPRGLGYQALISLLAATTWALIVRFAWPTDLEEWADAVEGEEGA